MKDHEIAELVNELTLLARKYGGTQQIRDRISRAVCEKIKPDTSTDDLKIGTWYQSKCTGMWYRNPRAAGEIGTLMVDGKYYYEYQRDLPLAGI